MGDTGSQFLGFSLGVLVILLSQTVNSAMSPLIPLFILGLPILDTMAVMGQRIYEGRSPFAPDKNHIHHKLLAIGFDHYEAVLAIYVVQSILIAVAYFMLYESDALLLVIYIAISGFVLGFFHISRLTSWKFHGGEAGEVSRLKSIAIYLREKGVLTTVPTQILRYIVPLILLSAAAFAVNIKSDMAVLAALLLFTILVSLLIKSHLGELLEKSVVYITAVIAVYLMPVNQGDLTVYNIINILFVLLALAFAMRVRFSYEKTFQITPLDYLVITLFVIIPNLPEAHLEDSSIGEMAVKLVILFYASEALMGIAGRGWSALRFGVIISLATVIIRGL